MKFEDLEVWKLSKELTILIYKQFESNKDYGFKDQIQRATLSIMNNIAEGFEKGTIKDKQKFFIISRGSSGEVRSMLYIALELNYISQEIFDSMIHKTISISKMLSSLINNIKF